MDVQGKTVLVLGAAGEMGLEVCRLILMEAPKGMIVAASRRETSEGASAKLKAQLPKMASGTTSSLHDRGQGFWKRTDSGELIIDPGETAGWILTYEEKGERMKD